MKTQAKVLIAALCAVLLVVGSVMGTLAYLTDRQAVVNTFTVGNVDITVDEAPVTPDGEVIPGEDRVEGNDYHLIPGQTYTKDPTMTVKKGSEESYVRMMVTINCISQLRGIFGDGFLPHEYIDGKDSNIWVYNSTVENGDNTVTYEFRYYKTVDAFEATEDIVLEPLFTSFTIPGELTGEQLATIADLEIRVEGHAIQTASFDSADAAWTAFGAQI
jgi:predicted ribosomally synthesized peptide with SipW-like signal peptide